MKEQSLETLFMGELKDIFNAELQLMKALPNAAKAAQSDDLRQALEMHIDETLGQIDRLKGVFQMLEMTARGKACKAMEGLVEECTQILDEYEKSSLRDAGIITKCQRIEHYEMATYGSLVLFAKELDFTHAAGLLQANLDEEINANQKLAKLAEGGGLFNGIFHQASVGAS